MSSSTVSDRGNMSLAASTVYLQLSLATLLLFISGSFFSLSVFGRYVEQAADPVGGLDDVWSSAMAFMGLVSVPFMFMAGVVLNGGKQSLNRLPFGASKTDRLRMLSLFASFSIPFLSLAPLGILANKRGLIMVAVGVQGIPFNLYFLLSLEMLAAWAPKRPGFAVGCGQLLLGIGSILFSGIYKFLIDSFGCLNAIHVSSLTLAIITSFATLFIRWPPPTNTHLTSDELKGPLFLRNSAILHWHNLPFLKSFWLYVAVFLTAQQGFVFIPYLFKIGESFGRPMESLINVFEGMFLVAALCRPLVGLLADSLKAGSGFFSTASKNTAMIIMTTQTLVFVLLIPISAAGNYVLCISAIAILSIGFGAGECLAPILARDMFGACNSSLIFGAGGSIAFGVGAYATTKMMSVVVASKQGSTMSPAAFIPFYIMSSIWSLGGVLATVIISVHQTATTDKSHMLDNFKNEDVPMLGLDNENDTVYIERGA